MEDKIVFVLENASELTGQSNQEMIQTWLLAHNESLRRRKDQDALNVLTLYVILFETLAGLKPADQITKEGDQIHLVSGPAIPEETAIGILKLVNYHWAYLELDQLKEDAAYSIFMRLKEGALTEEITEAEFGDWYRDTNKQYENCKFDRIVYVLNRKIYYSDQLLTEEEISYMLRMKPKEQIRYHVDHHDNGGMYCW